MRRRSYTIAAAVFSVVACNQPIEALIDQALSLAEPALDSKQKNRIVIKSVSTKQRPRRPAQ